MIAVLLLLSCVGCSAQSTKSPHIDGWTLNSCTRQQVADGVEYMHLVYNDSDELPHAIYVLTVDPEKATLHTGTSENGFDLMPSNKQNVMQHMQASVDDGLQVVAAVNGDFFAISSTYMPTGLCIKNGTVIRDNTAYRPYCAMTTNGQYLVCDGKTDKIDLSSLQMAVGGSHVIVKDGKSNDVGSNDTFSTTFHPRTLSGITKDGKILLVVVDGRQPSLSNGASLVICAKIMLALGAVHAINHDGGGSSTMVIRDGERFETINSPSDGDLRKVYNSIQVVINH